MSLLADFYTPEERKVLIQTSNLRGLAFLVPHVALLMIGIALCWGFWGSWLYWPVALVSGIVLSFLFAPAHECIHRTAFKSSRLNDWVARCAGWLLVLPSEYFRYFHFAHHRHTGDPEQDPELASPRPASWPAYLIYLTGLPYWFSAIVTTINLGLGRNWPRYIPKTQRGKIQREAQLYLTGYASVLGASLVSGSFFAVAIWVFPALLGQPFLRAFLLAEHASCDLNGDMLANTRTTLTSKLLQRLAWNMSFHTEHHSAPSVPFHQLPVLHGRLSIKIKHLSASYPAAHGDIQASLK